MNKFEVVEKILTSENGGLYAVIGGIVFAYGIDRITKSRYRTDIKKDSFTLATAGEAERPQATATKEPL